MADICETVRIVVKEPHLYKVINKSDLTDSDVIYVEAVEVSTDLAEEVAAKRGRPKKVVEAE